MAVLYQNLQYSESCYNEVVLYMGPSKTQTSRPTGWLGMHMEKRASLQKICLFNF